MGFQELDRLADDITTLAGARQRIPAQHLVRETALNILILTRVASNRLDDHQRREEIEAAGDELVKLLRQAARDLPALPQPDTESPPA
jgi:hypothetical protein